MGEKTGIAWTDSTWNPWIGCTKVGPGCDNCYAVNVGARSGVNWGAGAPRRRTFNQILETIPHSVTFNINGISRTRAVSEEDRISGARELMLREEEAERRRTPPKPRRVCRVGTSYRYLGPNRKVALTYSEAKAAFAALAKLQVELDAEIAYGKETGLGDFAKVTRLLHEIAKAEGRE